MRSCEALDASVVEHEAMVDRLGDLAVRFGLVEAMLGYRSAANTAVATAAPRAAPASTWAGV